MEPYYYSQMNKVQQNAYHAMKTGLMSMAPLFMVPKLENRELGDIFFQLRLDLSLIHIFFRTAGKLVQGARSRIYRSFD